MAGRNLNGTEMTARQEELEGEVRQKLLLAAADCMENVTGPEEERTRRLLGLAIVLTFIQQYWESEEEFIAFVSICGMLNEGKSSGPGAPMGLAHSMMEDIVRKVRSGELDYRVGGETTWPDKL